LIALFICDLFCNMSIELIMEIFIGHITIKVRGVIFEVLRDLSVDFFRISISNTISNRELEIQFLL
jgi:hypothetical protein